MFDILMMTKAKPERLDVVAELLTVEQVAAITGMAVRTVWTRVAEGKFPQPVKNGRSTRWRRRDVNGWMDSLAEDL